MPMIVGEIRRYLRDNTSIRVSRSLRDMAYKALSAKERLVNKNSKEPTVDEIAAELGVTRKEVSAALDAIMDPVSLYEPVYHDGGDAIFVMDQVKDEKNLDDSWLSEIAIKEAMGRLNRREQNILKLRFFMGRTQMEIANEIGISQAQVSRLEKNALGHMKKYL
ncbi:MAG: sigma-70 family RNA polymerase sigma factor [Clostridia bacterium]|nr:sigma-70 family RNA polymerase sigma factor [Oscillospiraceae bacterium]MBQ7959919.1 sigma-70 family RNA polymerase sigma factor [Clostridia bacterium]